MFFGERQGQFVVCYVFMYVHVYVLELKFATLYASVIANHFLQSISFIISQN